MSPKSTKAVEKFSEAAQSHGWQSDQGSPDGAEIALKKFNRTKRALEKRINELEVALAAGTLAERIEVLQ